MNPLPSRRNRCDATAACRRHEHASCDWAVWGRGLRCHSKKKHRHQGLNRIEGSSSHRRAERCGSEKVSGAVGWGW